jgi:hypothetical protein
VLADVGCVWPGFDFGLNRPVKAQRNEIAGETLQKTTVNNNEFETSQLMAKNPNRA